MIINPVLGKATQQIHVNTCSLNDKTLKNFEDGFVTGMI